MEEKPYHPIACALHESYEYAVLRRAALDLCWLGPDDTIVSDRLLPEDVFTLKGAEYLQLLAPDGNRLVIHLDHIVKAVWVATGEPLPGGVSKI